jgi:hypothetical protein
MTNGSKVTTHGVYGLIALWEEMGSLAHGNGLSALSLKSRKPDSALSGEDFLGPVAHAFNSVVVVISPLIASRH